MSRPCPLAITGWCFGEHPEGFGPGTQELRTGEPAVSGHVAQHLVAARPHTLGMAPRIEALGRLDLAGEGGRLGGAEPVRRDAEERLGGGSQSVGVVAEVHLVEIPLQELVLRVPLLEAHGIQQLTQLAERGPAPARVEVPPGSVAPAYAIRRSERHFYAQGTAGKSLPANPRMTASSGCAVRSPLTYTRVVALAYTRCQRGARRSGERAIAPSDAARPSVPGGRPSRSRGSACKARSAR